MREFLMLGPLEVRQDGVPVDLGSPKQRVVLSALVLARGAVVSTDRLVDAVWGESPPPAASTSLQAYISNLRRALRDQAGDRSPIERVKPGYRLSLADDRVDMLEFGALAKQVRAATEEQRWDAARELSETALRLWRGPLLQDAGDQDWVAIEASALTETRRAVAEAHITALLAAADTGAALAEIAALRGEDPLRERGVWLHMLALYRAGRGAEALSVFTEHSETLDAELGLDPGTELRELQGSILRHDPEIAAWPREPHWSGSTTVSVAAEPAIAVDVADAPVTAAIDDAVGSLVGRDSEMRSVREFLEADRAVAGWLALSGPAGIGKTRLAQEAARIAAAAGDKVVWIRCPDAGGLPAWWPLRQLCRDLAADPADVLSVPADADADGARFAVYERVQSLIESAARQQPLTVIIDDVQWADPMSLGLLVYLTGTTRDCPLRMIVTVREEEIEPAVERLRAALVRVGRVITVPALRRDEVRLLVEQVAGADVAVDEVDMLFDRTGGNPLYVSEYARLPSSERREVIPAAVRSVLDRRLASLDPAVLEVVGYASVIGDEIDPRLVAEVMGRDLESIADCLDEAADERIVVAEPGRRRTVFGHALLREEAMASIRPLRRCRINLRVAEILKEQGGQDVTARRAGHLLAALPIVETSEAIEACRAAAAEATARWDSENSAYWLQSALRTYESLPQADQDVAVRDGLLIDMLGAQSRAGRVQLVLDTVEARLGEAIRAGGTATAGRLASALVRAGGGWPWIAPTAEISSLHGVLADAEACVVDDPASAARVLGALAIGHCYHPDAAVPADYLARAEALAESLDDPDVSADVMLARLITYAGAADRAQETMDLARAIQQLPHVGSPVDLVITDSVITMATMTLGDIEATEHHLRRGIAGSERMRLPILRAQLRWMQAALAVWRGEFDLARSHLGTAIAVHRQTELYVAGSGALATMAMATQRGLFDEIGDDVLGIERGDRIGWARAAVTVAPENRVAVLLASGVAIVARDHGDDELARAMVTAWIAHSQPMVWTSLAQAVILANIVVELDMADWAPRFIDYLIPFRGYIATVGQVGCVGPVDLVLAQLHYLLGQDADGDEALKRARELCEYTGGAPDLLKCRLVAAVRSDLGPGREAELVDIETQAGRMELSAVVDAARAARAR
ncbi:BTAD domain-containing putative transcriptional regulator [Jongsikchunia kroppenstedtii]|uniref:BTAD domain-containing putative transcriptional regulator n=1 Tax=Jongsikchunia kroppenstedtii TaxID=1121721 RepID=UPI00037059FA|nr:BTAD domain-containing putative transcriptional regulator [Jongsikchunia kroppenstedtii]